MTNPQAAPAPFSFGGQDFHMAPLTDKDRGELNHFIKMQIIKVARDSCQGETNPLIINGLMKAAMSEVSSIDWMVQPELLEAPSNILYLFWIGVRATANCSKEDFNNLVLSNWEEAFGACMDAMRLVNPTLLSKKQTPVEPEPE